MEPFIFVALRKESVDRNQKLTLYLLLVEVALRKESVDRNIYVSHELQFGRCRSPQGERG